MRYELSDHEGAVIKPMLRPRPPFETPKFHPGFDGVRRALAMNCTDDKLVMSRRLVSGKYRSSLVRKARLSRTIHSRWHPSAELI